jgi:predicted RNA-binding protein YlxR (DUF448 family)
MTAPVRTCLGCRRARPKAELVRLARGGDGVVRVDARGRAGGRGAYVCANAECARLALTRARLGHAFRGACTPPAEEPEAMVEYSVRRG